MDDPERLAEKLRPLMPQRAQRWLTARRSADQRLKDLIDHQIVGIAQRTFGDLSSTVLLNLPPAAAVKGSINLGTVVYAGDRSPAGITPGELLQNVCVLGRSGSGKTNTSFHLILQLTDLRIPWLFVDVKRSARHLTPLLPHPPTVWTPGRDLLPCAFNPFTPPPGLQPRVYAGQVVDLLADAYTLGDGAISILQSALAGLYERGNLAPRVDDLLIAVAALPDKGRAGGWIITVRRALEALALAGIAVSQGADQRGLIQDLLGHNSIIEIDALSASARQFFVPALCLWLYGERLVAEDREKLRLVLVLEEASHFLHRAPGRARETVMETLLRQCREIGIGVIVVAQHPSLLSSAALGNTFTTICHNLKDVPDVNRAAAVLGLDEADKVCLRRLPVGQAVVRLQDRYRRPFLVRVPPVPVNKGSVTDGVLVGLLGGSGGGIGPDSAASARETPNLAGFGHVQVPDAPLSGEPLAFLGDVLAYPDDGVKARYRRLGFSGYKGNRIKRRLVREGWLEAQAVAVGNTRKVMLRLTSMGRSALGHDAKGSERESLGHHYWKHRYANLLARHGYEVQTEAARNGGDADIAAMRDGERIAVEIETGQSDAVGNVRRGLHAHFTKIIVVVTERAVRPRIERALAAAGLLVPGRVEVRMAGEPLGLGAV
jgi:hypothetical protein